MIPDPRARREPKTKHRHHHFNHHHMQEHCHWTGKHSAWWQGAASLLSTSVLKHVEPGWGTDTVLSFIISCKHAFLPLSTDRCTRCHFPLGPQSLWGKHTVPPPHPGHPLAPLWPFSFQSCLPIKCSSAHVPTSSECKAPDLATCTLPPKFSQPICKIQS